MMERNGVVNAQPIWGNKVSTSERFALAQSPYDSTDVSPLLMSWTGMGLPTFEWLASSFIPEELAFIYSNTWKSPSDSDEGGPPISPVIGGPAILPVADSIYFAATAQDPTQALCFGYAPNDNSAILTLFETTDYLSVDTPALGLTPAGEIQIAFAGVDPNNYLTITQAIGPAPFSGELFTPAVTYPDQCIGGPTLVTTVNGYAAAYVNKSNFISLLYGVENLDPAKVNRVIYSATSWHAPAIATLNGVTYVAWIGTDDPTGNGFPTGQLNFADLGSLTAVNCPVGDTAQIEAGPRADEIATRMRRLRDITMSAEPSGRLLTALLAQHSTELGILFGAHSDLRRSVWDALQRFESTATSHQPFTDDTIAAAQKALQQLDTLAGPLLRESLRHAGDIVASLSNRTFVEGLAAASRSFPELEAPAHTGAQE
ncbi:hypothetical protein C1Y40_00293 [Mycobacterium talmoniae]|nr:hypothetical protein C1Y40_00293 [Mycobacterium talmoniae]